LSVKDGYFLLVEVLDDLNRIEHRKFSQKAFQNVNCAIPNNDSRVAGVNK
jgi:hypothetical protein